MKILNIKSDENKIIVEVEGYPHAQPVFDAKIKPEELEVKLKAWKIKQDEVDAINLAEQAKAKIEPVISKELTDLIGKEIK